MRFADLQRLVVALGFRLVDIEGSYHLYEHARHRAARLNLQPVRGEAKPYQIKQLLKLVEEYDLGLNGDTDDR